ncbi:hypothetical protein Peur_041535 [Populus x canadensis]
MLLIMLAGFIFSSDLFFSRTERNSIIIYAVLLSSWSETCILELQFGCYKF